MIHMRRRVKESMNEVVEEGGVDQLVSECMRSWGVHWARVWGVVGMRRVGCLVG